MGGGDGGFVWKHIFQMYVLNLNQLLAIVEKEKKTIDKFMWITLWTPNWNFYNDN